MGLSHMSLTHFMCSKPTRLIWFQASEGLRLPTSTRKCLRGHCPFSSQNYLFFLKIIHEMTFATHFSSLNNIECEKKNQGLFLVKSVDKSAESFYNWMKD